MHGSYNYSHYTKSLENSIIKIVLQEEKVTRQSCLLAAVAEGNK